MVAALRERDWEGDVELADQLDALLANGMIPDLRPLPVDLEELSDILEGDPMNGGGRIDLQTGDAWPEPAVGRPGTVARRVRAVERVLDGAPAWPGAGLAC
jgi:hypothetical protein